MFAVAVIPVAGFVGAAVDYSRASAARTELQAALDAAALMVFRDAATSTPDQLTQRAADAVAAQFTRPEAQNLSVQASYTTAPTSVTVTGSADLSSNFMRLVGVSTMNIKTSASVTWGFSKLRVALALDNTGSMVDNGKIDALKTATKSLLSNLQSASKNPGDILVSIVPFANDVNVGTANASATWLDWTSWDAANGQWCTTKSCSATQTRGSVWKPNSHSTWTGCVMDRDQNYDVNVTAPVTTNVSTLFPAQQDTFTYNGTVYNFCPTVLKPLSSDWAGMSALVDKMTPNGPTNQTIGLVWAWHSLTPGAPLNAAPLDPTTLTQQYIILLSDGLNTINRWSGDGTSVSPAVDARMALVCANAKAAGIQVYTVQVNTGGDPTSTVLQNCASSPDKFFELKSASAMVATFNTISSQLAALRISR